MYVDEVPIRRRTTQTPPPDQQGGRRRLLLLMTAVALVFAALSSRVLFLQTTRRAEFESQAVQRSTKTRALPPTRGLIYDRNGIPLVRNAPAYQVAIIPIKEKRIDAGESENALEEASIEQRMARMAVYNRLAQVINLPGVTAGDIFTKVFQARRAGNTFEPVVVAENVPRETALAIQEQSLILEGVTVQTVGSRVYPYKELLGNILGYTGKIFAETRDRYENDPDYQYDIDNDRVGVTGIESFVEKDVRGVKGLREVVLDASFEEREVLKVITPTNGNSARLTLDLRLQTILSDVVSPIIQSNDFKRLAVVALDPNTAEVLGMFSYPSYDNNLFARGITVQENKIYSDNIHLPYLNHATQDVAPPGSTFKIVTTAALLQEGYVDFNTVVNDPGTFELPNINNPQAPGQKFYCWIGLNGGSHGPQRVTDALRNSCDTFYYKTVGGFEDTNEKIKGMGVTLLSKWGNLFGIGEPYELGIPKRDGSAPTPNDVAKLKGKFFSQGDAYNYAIGQGEVLATPLEMANIMATMANGGTVYQPQIVREIVNEKGEIVKAFEPKPLRKLPLDPTYVAAMQSTLRDVVNVPGATASGSTLKEFGLEYAGKTGTAEFCDDVAFKLGICYTGIKIQPTHAWFVAYAPVENPQIALAVYVWNGGQGSGVAAPIAQRILARYFNLSVPEEKFAPVKKGLSE
jgi:penicillin-binding protein 2